MKTEQVVARVRAAAEELTGVESMARLDMRDARSWSPPRRIVLGVSVASVVALVAGLVVLGAHRDGATGEPTPPWATMVVDDDAGGWLDLGATPAGLRASVDLGLAATTVCLHTDVVDGLLRCTALEGQIASNYVPVSAPANPDQTLYEVEIRTAFVEVDVAAFARSVTGRTPTDATVRGRDGFRIVDDEAGATTLVWSERNGAVTTLRVTTRSGLDPTAVADALVMRAWPAEVRPPIAAVDFGLEWRAYDNNHPYALATTRGASECVSVGYLAACTDGPAAWTIGGVTDHATDAASERADIDVVAGLVPSDVTSVRFRHEDGRLIEVPTVEVPGFRSRAFGFPTGSPQGALVVGELSGAAGGTEAFRMPVVALLPTVYVDSVCAVPGATHVVPDVVGRDLRSAEAALRAAGLLVALPVTADEMPVVASQDPPAGTQRGCGDVLLGYVGDPSPAAEPAR